VLALSLDIKAKDICHSGHVGGRDQGILGGREPQVLPMVLPKKNGGLTDKNGGLTMKDGDF